MRKQTFVLVSFFHSHLAFPNVPEPFRGKVALLHPPLSRGSEEKVELSRVSARKHHRFEGRQVRDDHVVVAREHDVAGLEVPVRDTRLVHAVERGEELVGDERLLGRCKEGSNGKTALKGGFEVLPY